MVRYIVRVVYHRLTLRRLAGSVAKIRDLVHIQPTTREIYLSVQMSQHIFPILGRIRMEIINKLGQPSPNLPDLILSLRRLNIHIPLLPLLPSIPLPVPYTRLNYRHVPVLIRYLLHPVQWKIVSIDRKCLVIVHIVYIAPDHVQWDSVLLVL